jgi:signal transduction histidine kinase
LALFPYCLFRFTGTFARPARWQWWLAHILTTAVVVSTFLLPAFPEPGEPRPPLFQAWVVALLLTWTFLSVSAAGRLWRAGRRQPTVARRRMRLLALGSISLNIGLVVAGLRPAGDEPNLLALASQIVNAASGPFFYLGFAPPAILRMSWRRPEERSLRDSEAELMAAMTTDAVADALLPHVAALFGGRGAILVAHGGAVLGSFGLSLRDAEHLVAELGPVGPSAQPGEIRAGVLYQPMRNAGLAVLASPYAPFFGREELELLQTIALFADLALERTELVETEREAREAVEAANAELESFVYSASHDLKNPLVTLMGYLEFLRSDYGEGLGDEGRHYIDRMTVSAAYMQALINDLLELSRIGRLQTEAEPVDLGAVAAEIIQDCRASYPQATVEVGELPTVLLNRLRVRQLMTNLVENALKHGGRDDLAVRVDAARVEDAVRLAVIDNGRGVPSAYREKVFGVFERLDGSSTDVSRGTGIGLAVCRKIVEQFGGRIWIGDADSGTEIFIDLPADIVVRERTTV